MKQTVRELFKISFVFFEVSFEKPEDKDVLIFFYLAPFKSSIIAFSLRIRDDEHRESVLVQYIIHKES